MATLWEIAAHSVDHTCMLSLYCLFVILIISRFRFEGWIWVLIASVPDLCILFYLVNALPLWVPRMFCLTILITMSL